MTLKDLKDIDFKLSVDFADNEIDATIYFELEEIDDDIASEIVVTRISKNYVTCKFTNYLRRLATFHPTQIKNYINDNYYDGETKDYLIKQLTKRKLGSNVGDITDDGGEAVYHFIENDLYDFLTNKDN